MTGGCLDCSGSTAATSDRIGATPIQCMLSRKVALGLSVLAAVTACGTRAEVETATPRPALRISMRQTEILSAFLDLPQFSFQAVTIGDAQKAPRSP